MTTYKNTGRNTPACREVGNECLAFSNFSKIMHFEKVDDLQELCLFVPLLPRADGRGLSSKFPSLSLGTICFSYGLDLDSNFFAT